MPKIVRILLTLFMTVLFAVLAFLSWNGWLADHGINNRIVAMLAALQRWLVLTLGAMPAAGIFALCAIFMLVIGLMPEKRRS